MSYTVDDARKEVRDSTSWEDGHAPSLRKWKQLSEGDTISYPESTPCGFCLVAANLGLWLAGGHCGECPAVYPCRMRDAVPGDVLRALQELNLERKRDAR